MEKKVYVTPKTEKNYLAIENLMLTASPGVDNSGFDPTQPIDSKEFDFFEEESEIGSKGGNQSHWDY